MAETRDAVVFKANLRGSFKEVQRKARILLDGLAFTLYADIVEDTPVDTGRARAGWMISVFVAGKDSPPDLGPKATHPKPTPDQFIGKLSVAPLQAKRVIYNNVEYIIWLEIGTPRSAGKHMVQMAIQRLRTQVLKPREA